MTCAVAQASAVSINAEQLDAEEQRCRDTSSSADRPGIIFQVDMIMPLSRRDGCRASCVHSLEDESPEPLLFL